MNLSAQTQTPLSVVQMLALSADEWAARNPPEPVEYAPLKQKGIDLWMKREDRLHPQVSGNKAYKLLGHWQQANAQNASCLLSFGGYYSNHLHALANFGASVGVNTVGIIRGHEPERLTPTLEDCRALGMTLKFVSRQRYRDKLDPQWLAQLSEEFPRAYIIPEGGADRWGMLGCSGLMSRLRTQIDLQNATICLPCGTGTTLAGMASVSIAGETLLGFSALKLGERYQQYCDEIACMMEGFDSFGRWSINADFHCGGFARQTPELLAFSQDFEESTDIALDPVYTAKMMFGIVQLASQGRWNPGQRIIAIHTGGLQGRRSPGITDDLN
ncbi:pyridoxal-phosphate dependent enzyme [Pseudomaricurvus alkylphenolicus]|uniref:1-aminocyclopropane-1-carboxylate deaminase/D-cysteine desulfhydrase n=1 Tax=Pseudomaricurvus alkylphenolicus TaxID=1306991 RepID=UPI00141EB76F|nr:pyridoxal-phosphate dependent enzyme [Pseudomaricurvus alkylphenolicus]NIB41136.1 pyridoxal-phosphate dependent enzyme [Pseudomaricurvus alkylphenolicus]